MKPIEFMNKGSRSGSTIREGRVPGGLIYTLVLLLTVSLGCGYRLGYRTPPQVSTLAVPIFHNATFPLRRDVEYDLTEIVRKEFHTRTRLRIIDSDKADMTLKGTIVDFREVLIADEDRDRKVESSLIAIVDVTLEDHVNGVRREYRVTTTEPFSTASGESFRSTRAGALTNLAERIIAQVEYWDDYEVEEEI